MAERAPLLDVWQMVKVGFLSAPGVKEAEPGSGPDLDMLPWAKLGLKISYKGPDREFKLQREEFATLIDSGTSRMPLNKAGIFLENRCPPLSFHQRRSPCREQKRQNSIQADQV